MYASVLIITYNHSSYIEECLESAKKECSELSDLNVEIIVIDDGSKDDTAAKAARFVDETLHLHVQENGGPSASMNSAFAKAKGDYLVILSGDDLFTPGGLKERLSHLDRSGADLVCSRPEILCTNPSLKQKLENKVFRSLADGSSATVYRELFYKNNFICAPTVAMKRAVWDKLGLFRTDLLQLQDYEYWLRATAKGFSFSFSEIPTAQYRMHSNNLSMKNMFRVRRETEAVRRQSTNHLEESVLKSIVTGNGIVCDVSGIMKRHILPFLFLEHKDLTMKRVGIQLLDDLMLDENDRILMTNIFGMSPEYVYNLKADYNLTSLYKVGICFLKKLIGKN